ncbi:uncharacterized protein CC84DRAFT_1172051 [Paraphaeosphaeria sporulosa]|uniref:Uncharacterized protein n=1 Tax=Paraphaeosphaeria sporulosa TaxID=1460663 RepID=A0A177CR85_9PLEO|nr:uncharacterized protein CC84DRAFT_1172051 [Paraphaeosphaeria sporulosa]OAG09478.1 hypothetical protein CC84DRAFT_1172051 [Paraphaeosphaeria sporulosa]
MARIARRVSSITCRGRGASRGRVWPACAGRIPGIWSNTAMQQNLGSPVSPDCGPALTASRAEGRGTWSSRADVREALVKAGVSVPPLDVCVCSEQRILHPPLSPASRTSGQRRVHHRRCERRDGQRPGLRGPCYGPPHIAIGATYGCSWHLPKARVLVMPLPLIRRVYRDCAALVHSTDVWMQRQGPRCILQCPVNAALRGPRAVVPTLAGSRGWDGGARVGVPEAASLRDDKRETEPSICGSGWACFWAAGDLLLILHCNRYQRRWIGSRAGCLECGSARWSLLCHSTGGRNDRKKAPPSIRPRRRANRAIARLFRGTSQTIAPVQWAMGQSVATPSPRERRPYQLHIAGLARGQTKPGQANGAAVRASLVLTPTTIE